MQEALGMENLNSGAKPLEILPDQQTIGIDTGLFQPMIGSHSIECSLQHRLLAKIDDQVKAPVVHSGSEQMRNDFIRAGISGKTMKLPQLVMPNLLEIFVLRFGPPGPNLHKYGGSVRRSTQD